MFVIFKATPHPHSTFITTANAAGTVWHKAPKVPNITLIQLNVRRQPYRETPPTQCGPIRPVSEGITLAEDFLKRITASDKRRRQTHGFDKAALSCQAALGVWGTLKTPLQQRRICLDDRSQNVKANGECLDNSSKRTPQRLPPHLLPGLIRTPPECDAQYLTRSRTGGQTHELCSKTQWGA